MVKLMNGCKPFFSFFPFITTLKLIALSVYKPSIFYCVCQDCKLSTILTQHAGYQPAEMQQGAAGD